MANPKLSIVVPVYNVEGYIRKCIDSILNQTFSDFELIIVDDGSDDSSVEICDWYRTADCRVIVIHQQNAGMSAARNTGIKHARGKYVAFVDSDDWIDYGMYASMVDAVDRTGADIAVCGHRVVDESGATVETVVFGSEMLLTSDEAVKLILRDEIMPSFAWNKIFRRSLFSNILFPVGRIYEDTAVMYKYFDAATSIAVVDKIFYNYLRRAGSICLDNDTKKQKRRMFDNFRAFYERYLFASANRDKFGEVLSVCENKAISMGLNFIHYLIKNKANYSDEELKFAVKSLGAIKNILSLNTFSAKWLEMKLISSCPLSYYYCIRIYYMVR